MPLPDMPQKLRNHVMESSFKLALVKSKDWCLLPDNSLISRFKYQKSAKFSSPQPQF